MRAALKIADRSTGRDNNFNLIRMIAAVGVLVSHAFPIALGPETPQPLEAWLDGASLGLVSVMIFFAISGFFITKSFEQSRDWRRFLRARVLRLFPALIVALALTVVVSGLFLTSAEPKKFWIAGTDYVFRNATLFKLQYFLPGVFRGLPYGPTINGSLWTLNYEVLCYMAVLIAGVLGLMDRRRLFTLSLVVLLAACIVAPFFELPLRMASFLTLAFPFAFGSAIYIWRDVVPLSPRLLAALAATSAAAYQTPAFWPLFVLTISYGVIWLGLARIPQLLEYNRLGDYSYGVYIYAFPMQQLMAHHGFTDPMTNIALALPVIVMCAVISWHLIEKPALANGRFRRRSQRTGEATV